jgi:hypothetical protein
MEKKYIVGGLAILGAIALVAYLRKPKRNSEGFFGADGGKATITKASDGYSCAWCKDSRGRAYHIDKGTTCNAGDKCITRYS